MRPGESEEAMHPGMMWWWKHARRVHGGEEGAYAGEGGQWQAGPWHRGGGDDFGGGAVGRRRPLRFLAYKLDLRAEQGGQLAKDLDELNAERAPAAGDDPRTGAGFDDAPV